MSNETIADSEYSLLVKLNKIYEKYNLGCSLIKSKANVCDELEISIDEYEFEQKKDIEFKQIAKRIETISEARMADLAKLNMHNKDFNSQLWMFEMKTQYGWRDKIKVDDIEEMTQEDQEVIKKANEVIEKLRIKHEREY